MTFSKTDWLLPPVEMAGRSATYNTRAAARHIGGTITNHPFNRRQPLTASNDSSIWNGGSGIVLKFLTFYIFNSLEK
jgi:hypothetical protein